MDNLGVAERSQNQKQEKDRARVAVLCVLLSLPSFAFGDALLPQLPEGVQAMSLSGVPLISPEPSVNTLNNLAQARTEYDAEPGIAENIIWYGRRTAYAGDYRRAIEIFTEGVEKFPEDPRFFRHRGHRYLSIREFDRAIADLEGAAELMDGMPVSDEPDGLPNAQNIPLTTTQGNVWYHLGLAYYLKRDWPRALKAFRRGYSLGGYDDNLVSTGHWIYMILRLMDREAEALAALDEISAEMDIIENMSYHQLCLLYKGEASLKDMKAAGGNDPSNAAVAYGVANFLYYNGDRQGADDLLRRLVSGSSWSAFGVIAAEADLANPNR